MASSFPNDVVLFILSLSSSNGAARDAVREYLTALGPQTEAFVAELIPLLGHRDRFVVFATFRTLEMLGEKAVSAVPQLFRLFLEQREAVRKRAAEVLGQLGTQGAWALLSALRPGEPEDRRYTAASVLSRIPLYSSAGIAVLRQLFRDSKKTDLRGRCLQRLVEAGIRAVPTLLYLAEQAPSGKAYREVLSYLEHRRGFTVHAFPLLLRCLACDDDDEVRTWAQRVLLDVSNELASEIAAALLEHSNAMVRYRLIRLFRNPTFLHPRLPSGPHQTIERALECVVGVGV